MTIKQGNTHNLNIQLSTVNDEIIVPEAVSKIEFCFDGNELIRKIYDGISEDVIYDKEKQCFIVKFSQEDTFKFSDPTKYDIRVKFTNGDDDFSVKGAFIDSIDIIEALSKEVL